MVYHILNGDSLTERFKATHIPGQIVIMRECLIEGDLGGNTLTEFMDHRTRFLATTYDASPNEYSISGLIGKILHAPNHTEFNLWFEYDLFCMSNMWFLLSLMKSLNSSKNIFIIYSFWTTPAGRYRGFGPATAQNLIDWYSRRIQCEQKDLELALALWNAYKINDVNTLEELSSTKSVCFPYLEEVCFAHIDRFGINGEPGRPEKRIKAILKEFPFADFNKVFMEFTRWEGIYGFGDLQLKHIFEKMIDPA
ncbi:MAG: DUF1835 domain-containing protein [Saprospiraceae bacterium]